jgi:hypothetical protein
MSDAFTAFLMSPSQSPSPSTCRAHSGHRSPPPAKPERHPHLLSNNQAGLQQHPFLRHPAVHLQVAANLCPRNSSSHPHACLHHPPCPSLTTWSYLAPSHRLLRHPFRHHPRSLLRRPANRHSRSSPLHHACPLHLPRPCIAPVHRLHRPPRPCLTMSSSSALVHCPHRLPRPRLTTSACISPSLPRRPRVTAQ